MEVIKIYHSCIAFCLGFILDCIIGDPEFLPHPVRWIGRLISFLDKKLYKENLSEKSKFMRGIILVVIVIVITAGLSLLIIIASYKIHIILGIFVESGMCFYCIAAKNLKDESMNVYHFLNIGDLAKSRKAVARIVGRDTDVLDEIGVAKAAIETVAESLNDGVIAPMFYLALGGGILGMVYKAVNTMDSMIGYKNQRYRYFGTAAAHTDDAFGFIPSRIAAFSMMASSFLLRYDAGNAFRIWKRDRHNHESPNSAQTESTCAGALRIQLAGDAYYDGKLEHKPLLGDNFRTVESRDIVRANILMYCSSILTAIVFISFKIIFGYFLY
ncbi:MAG: adenosylcobinamide-phosphate synthase CbiB [Treponema sp.]|nr:adenosylcobinamide-phosphate synthase CbiB [Treponema sp.]